MWTRIALLLAAAAAVLAGPAALTAVRGRPSYDRTLETSLYYRIPEGFQGVRQPAGIFLYPATGAGAETPVLVLTREVLVDPPLRGSEAQQGRAALAQSIAQAIGASLIGDAAPLVREEVSPPPPRGVPLEVRSFSIAAKKGRQVVRRMRARVMFDGVAFHLLIATDGNGNAQPGPLAAAAYERLYASLGFARLGDPRPLRLAAPLPDRLPAPGRVEADARDERQAEIRPRAPSSGPQCRTVQRQQCSGGIGTSLGYFCTTIPQRVCD